MSEGDTKTSRLRLAFAIFLALCIIYGGANVFLNFWWKPATPSEWINSRPHWIPMWVPIWRNTAP
jgi:hypothetical protein